MRLPSKRDRELAAKITSEIDFRSRIESPSVERWTRMHSYLSRVLAEYRWEVSRAATTRARKRTR